MMTLISKLNLVLAMAAERVNEVVQSVFATLPNIELAIAAFPLQMCGNLCLHGANVEKAI